MLSLFKRELRSFFSSLTAYLIISIFLIGTGLFVWVFPGNSNPLDTSYASLEIFFEMAPWLFLFLIPAISMRLFAEEKRQGTIELMVSRPLSDLQIVLAKYVAALLVIAFALFLCLIYYYSIYHLGSPVGSVDSGAFWGSYIGLLFVASAYVAIGVFASSLTENQIVAFLLALLLCFTFYIGFDYLADLPLFQQIQTQIYSIGMNEHYRSISRGIIDSRDLIYFLSLTAGFILMTQTVLKSRKW